MIGISRVKSPAEPMVCGLSPGASELRTLGPANLVKLSRLDFRVARYSRSEGGTGGPRPVLSAKGSGRSTADPPIPIVAALSSTHEALGRP